MGKPNVVVTVSGGIDSTVVLTQLVRSGMAPLAFIIDQGFRSHVGAAQSVCANLGVRLEVIDLSLIMPKLQKPGTNYYSGYRAFNYLTALSLADANDINSVYTGEMACPLDISNPEEDPAWKSWSEWLGISHQIKEGWIVARQKFAALFNFMYAKDPDDGISFIDPLYGMDKASVIRLGNALSAPLNLTLTCRNKQVVEGLNKEFLLWQEETPTHCGSLECWSCNQRKSAFIMAGCNDPSTYYSTAKVGGKYADYLFKKGYV